MTNYDVVKKLIGLIEPIGESNTDEKRLNNLRELMALSDCILHSIIELIPYKNRPEFIMKKIGKEAFNYIKDLKYICMRNNL